MRKMRAFKTGLLFLLVIIVQIAFSGNARACMGTGPDGYQTGMVWKYKPSSIPTGAMLVNVEDVRPVKNSYGFSGLVIKGPAYLLGKRTEFVPRNITSCDAIGARNGIVIISRRLEPKKSNEDEANTPLLEAYSYSESWLNWFLRFFSSEQWQYPGKPEMHKWNRL